VTTTSDAYSDKEVQILLACEAILAQQPEHVKVADFQGLVGDYSKLLRSFNRIIRISDRNELRMRSVSDELAMEKRKLQDIAQQLSRYLPQQVYEAVFAGGQTVEIRTERKPLTVFFSDIQGFAQMASTVQPEVLTKYINQYFSEMSDIALKYGGTVDKFIGDAMMIFFGDTGSKGQKEDALACVRMAYEMQQRIAELHVQWEKEGMHHPFWVRIGINTGYCNVGNFGSRNRMTYTILGGEVNLAARVEKLCEPGGVLMTHETYSLVKNYVEAVEHEAVAVKGIFAPVRTYALQRVLKADEMGQEDVRVKLPGAGKFLVQANQLTSEQFLIKANQLTMPERLGMVARLRDLANALDIGHASDHAQTVKA
jgi:adenylate cyclase